MTTIPLIYWIGGVVAILALITLFYFYSCSCSNLKI